MYTDPSFGGMIIQFVIAGIAVFGAYFVIFRKKVEDFLNRKRGISNDKKPGSDGEE